MILKAVFKEERRQTQEVGQYHSSKGIRREKRLDQG